MATAKKKPTESTACKVGETFEVGVGQLVRRPDGTVLTSGRLHVADVPGEYALVNPDGTETTVTVTKTETD